MAGNIRNNIIGRKKQFFMYGLAYVYMSTGVHENVPMQMCVFDNGQLYMITQSPRELINSKFIKVFISIPIYIMRNTETRQTSHNVAVMLIEKLISTLRNKYS